jgi:glycine/D-amino acid oxidase-like deaminating enzyme
MIPKFERRFPGLSGARLSSSYAGCYDVTPDYNPMISPSPLEGLWLCAGFSGHGYKISPSVGELMADLITVGTSRHPDVDHHDFRWDRFTTDDLLVSPHPYAGAGQMR